MTELKLEKFEGPLDLLLQLIDQEKLSISEIALSKVTEQFFSYLDRLEKNRPEQLADFLMIAARLIFLKSYSLLQYAMPEEEDSGPSLADQLKLYRQYVEASKKINVLWNAGKIAYGRIEPPVKIKEFVLPINARAENLRSMIEALLRRLKPIDPLPKVTIDHSISIKQKLDSFRDLLKRSKKFNFMELLEGAKNKTEVIVSFLALLELAKEKTIRIKQINSFEDMVVIKI
ncbi:MAG: segregation/condensation protein A [Patescibacteria group bacterium]